MEPDQDIPSQIVQCFLSYSRQDNDAMNGIADEIKARIEGLYRAKTGRDIKVFIDRQDIGWGDDWRERIAQSVRSATAFIPLVTMNYFNRSACREELMAFYGNAKVLGVTELVLPIALAGSRNISNTDLREEVRIIERLQYENLEGAWPHGYSSSQWLTALDAITDKLIDALERAENRLAQIEGSEGSGAVIPSTVPSSRLPITEEANLPGGDGEEENEEVETGTYYLMHEFGEHMREFGSVSPRATVDMGQFFETVTRALESLNTAPDRQSVTRRSIAAANEILGPSSRLGDSGAEVLGHISAADAALRQIVNDFSGINTPQIRADLRDSAAPIRQMFDNSPGILEQTDQIVQLVELAQRMSISLRRAVAPGYKGLSAVRDTIRILKSWDDLMASV